MDIAPIVIAALALLVSVVFGLRNRGTSKKALALAERQEARRESRVDVYINDSMAWRHDEGRCVGVNVVLANPADSPTSIVHAELHLTYDVRGTLATVRVRASSPSPASTVPAEVANLELPVRLDANGAVSGWFVFPLPDGLTDGRPVERYDFVTRDVHGKEETIQLGIYREHSHGEAPQDDR
ncbi:MAG: hypothetical protein AB7V15_02015 [Acidimicrobiia bacterium]